MQINSASENKRPTIGSCPTSGFCRGMASTSCTRSRSLQNTQKARHQICWMHYRAVTFIIDVLPALHCPDGGGQGQQNQCQNIEVFHCMTTFFVTRSGAISPCHETMQRSVV